MTTQSSESLEAGTILAGRYRVERQLGKGGMGSVYLVQHVHTEQQLALKLLHSTVVTDEVALTRFRREARAPAKIHSDHVVQVTDADVAPELGGVPFLVMEWLRGRDLEELVVERQTLPPEEVVLYLRQAARALDKAHALGIVHRDLKPENLFLTTREDGAPCLKILDFGIAKLTSENDGRFKATGTGQIFGTPLYMSPEQTKGESDKISPQTDIWAIGIIAHRLLTGREPWTATTLTGLVGQICYEPLPVPSKAGFKLGAAFDAWFLRACAREPNERFASASEAVAALGRALGVAEEVSTRSLRPSLPMVSSGRRDDTDRTAFSATAPVDASHASLPVGPTKVSASAPPSRSKMIIGALAGMVFSGVVAWAIVSATRTPPAAANPGPIVTSAPKDTAPSATVTVTPSTAAPPIETAAPTATATAKATATAPRPVKTAAPVQTAAVKPAPTPPPAPAPPPAPTPAKPEDPLGTRH